MTQLEAQVSSEWENKVKNFKEREKKLPKWDPSNPKNKEKPEIHENIEDDDIEDDPFLGPSAGTPSQPSADAPSEAAKVTLKFFPS